ncbi:hypothetical protein PGIGA_G00133320 [Pangasianodon gigas]|uniref:Uncharacterized protein n=1 Tax=Pangasianodon gigas TaxID=30993 RepID=A0ACC5XJR0_PANGG|nr:hypothetical protein [Pangasianodon gigas]
MNPNFVSTLYVGDLHPDVIEPMLVEKFSPAGHIHSIRLSRDQKTGSSLHYASINFQHRAEGPALNVHVVTDENRKSKGLGFVRFERHEDVQRIKVERFKHKFEQAMMENGHSRGFSFVHFSSSQEAMKARRERNGRIWGRTQVCVGVAQCKEEQPACLAHQNIQRMPNMQVKTVQNIYQPVPQCCQLHTQPNSQAPPESALDGADHPAAA